MKNLTIFVLMGIVYVCIEVFFSAFTGHDWSLVGTSSVWMFIVGGYLGLTVGKFSNYKHNVKYPLDVIAGAGLITLVELISGIILNIWLKFDIWDYSSSKFNFLGQIDYIHSFCWLLLTPMIFWLDDVIRHYAFGEARPKSLINYYLGRY